MIRLLAILLSLLCSSCVSHTQPRSLPYARVIDLWTEAQCRRAQTKKDWLTGVASGLGLVTGAGGLGAVFPSDERFRLGVGLTALGLGIAGAVIAPFASSATKTYADHCTDAKVNVEPGQEAEGTLLRLPSPSASSAEPTRRR